MRTHFFASEERFQLTEPMRRLGELSEEVDSIILDRNVEYMRKRSLQQRQRRKESEERWKNASIINKQILAAPISRYRCKHLYPILRADLA